MRLLFSLVIFFFSAALPLAGSIVNINGKWSSSRHAPKYSVTEHFNVGKELFQKGEWKAAADNFLVITTHFPESPFYGEALYFAALCSFHRRDFDTANKYLSRYLNHGTALQHFEQAFEYKYEIAKAFAEGARRHLFGMERLPKWLSAKKVANEIFDEVIAAMPSREVALKSLFEKAHLLFAVRHYKECVEAYALLIRRFPKQSLAAESYVLISEVYLEQAKLESQNPDFISLAKVNLQRFSKNFPADERIARVEKNLWEMNEVYAQTLYDIGQFYERKKKPKASLVYYNEAIKRYPDTAGAKQAHVGMRDLAGK